MTDESKREMGEVFRRIFTLVVFAVVASLAVSCLARAISNSVLNDDASQQHDRPQQR